MIVPTHKNDPRTEEVTQMAEGSPYELQSILGPNGHGYYPV